MLSASGTPITSGGGAGGGGGGGPGGGGGGGGSGGGGSGRGTAAEPGGLLNMEPSEVARVLEDRLAEALLGTFRV